MYWSSVRLARFKRQNGILNRIQDLFRYTAQLFYSVCNASRSRFSACCFSGLMRLKDKKLLDASATDFA